MKKIILSLFLSIIWFIGFSNAWTLNCSWEWNWDWALITCSPVSINSSLSDGYDSYDFTVLSSNLLNICDWEYSCDFNLYVGFEPDFEPYDWMPIVSCSYPYDEETPLCSPWNISFIDLDWNSVLYFKWLFFYTNEEDADATANLSISVDYSVYRDPDAPDEPDEPDEPWTWWNENPPVIPDNPWEWWNWWNIVPDWSLVAVISGVFSVFAELIPYVIYLWIWILIVTVWFYAIRWLVNWVSNKINNNFKF